MRWYGVPAVVAALGVGALAAAAPVVALALAGLVLTVAVTAVAGVYGLLALALAATWLGRAGLWLDVGTFASFADFPLVFLSLTVALLEKDRRRDNGFLVVLVLTLLVSAVATGTEPVRAVAGAIIVLQPFAAVAALITARRRPKGERLLLWTVALTLLIQIPVAFYQWATLGAGDPVQGTLVGSGAGAHVLGGGMVLAVLAYAAIRRHRPAAVLAAAVVGTTMVWITDTKQFIAVIPLGLGVLYLKGRGRPTFGRTLKTAIVFAVTAAPTLYLLSQTYVFNAVSLTAQTGGGKIAVASEVIADVNRTPTTVLFGLGAGETVSRLAQLTTDTKESSPVGLLGLGESARAESYQSVTNAYGYVGDSSFSNAQSNLLGTLGDYGWVGLFSYLLAVAMLCRRLWGSTHPLAGVALAGWVMALPLGVIADWLEQPPFMLLLAVFTGVALSSTRAGRPVVRDRKALTGQAFRAAPAAARVAARAAPARRSVAVP